MNIKVNGEKCWTLFDSGAENTYVVKPVARAFSPRKLRKTRRTRIRGRVHRITHACILEASIRGKPIEVDAYVTDRLGEDKKAGKPFDVIFGALGMQKWGIELNLEKERLDLSRYPDEFVEF